MVALKVFGPVHAYLNEPVPPLAVVVRFNVLPAQIGPLLPIAVIAGNGFTVAVIVFVPVAPHPLASVTLRLYTPLAAVVADVIDGFWLVELKVFGPVHEKLKVPVPPLAVLVRFNVLAAQIGPLLPMEVIAGNGFTVAVVVFDPVALQLLASVTDRL